MKRKKSKKSRKSYKFWTFFIVSCVILAGYLFEAGGNVPVPSSFELPWTSPACDSSLLNVKSKNTPEIILKRKTYICSFNHQTRCANWSAWYLEKEHADGPYKRKDLQIKSSYLEDERTIKGRQRLSDWRNTPGYDHGHLCPSGDNKYDLEAMRQTFYLSNMCVQNSALNQGPWEHLESTCRQWAKSNGGIYIITGPVYSHSKIKRTHSGIAIPDKFFKVVLCMEGTPKAIGFIYDNTTPKKGDKTEQHVCTIDEIERLTGFDFFASLPDEQEAQLEATSNFSCWK